MASSNSGMDVQNALYVYLPLAFAAMMTGFHQRTLRTKFGDFRGPLLYFAAFFGMFLAVPVLIILACGPVPGSSCGSSG